MYIYRLKSHLMENVEAIQNSLQVPDILIGLEDDNLSPIQHK